MHRWRLLARPGRYAQDLAGRRNSNRTERGIAEYLRQKAAAKDKAGSIGRVSEMKSLARTYECDANKLAEPRDGYTKEVSFVGYIL